MTSNGGPPAQARKVGHQCGPVGPAAGPALVGQPVPRRRAHHPAEEALDLLARVLGHGPSSAAAALARPRPAGTPTTAWAARTRPTASHSAGSARAAPITTSPPKLCPTHTR